MNGDIVLFRRYNSEFEAEVARSALDCEGIPSIIMRDDAGGMDPQFQLTLGVRLMVRQEDLERAHEIIDPVEREG